MGRKLLALAVAAALGFALVPASAAVTEGPEYPPPGGVDWNGTGEMGRAGGAVWSYQGLDMRLFQSLWWGPAGAEAVQLAFDGGIDEPGETLQFSFVDSDLANGVGRWMGSAEMPLFNGTIAVPTRFTLAADGPLAFESEAEVAGPGALVPVADAFSITLSLEAFHGGQWRGALDLYDELHQPGDVEGARTSVGGGFYFRRNVAPEAAISVDPVEPVAGEAVTLHANATDEDGEVASVAWDLDADGEYDDASGDVIQHTFPTPGEHVVGVEVIDDRGLEGANEVIVLVHRCDEGAVSGTVHDAVEPVAAGAGQDAAVHDLNCAVVAELGL